jgi:hypothetical protein
MTTYLLQRLLIGLLTLFALRSSFSPYSKSSPAIRRN